MGDAGSYFVGLLMASLTAAATFYESKQGSRHVLLAPLCVLAVPLYDFTSVMVIRLAQRRSPFQPDKSHFSHRLVELGLSPPRAVLTIYLATLTTGLAALVLYQVPGWGGACLVIVMVGCVLAIVAILETTGRRRLGLSQRRKERQAKVEGQA
jgi:UDP-GlcNAc:undecaprenyl-phosphate GlcNAc-1-phosphate transferase